MIENAIDLGHLILMVEDDRLSAAVQRQVLEDAGLPVFTVTTAADALQWAVALPLAAILLDISLPDMDGAVLALHLGRIEKTGYATFPVIAMTALDMTLEPRVEALAGLRIAAVWQKPLDDEKTNWLKTLGSCDTTAFWQARDTNIANDIKNALKDREAGLKAHLQQQIGTFSDLLEREIGNSELAFAVHALKSSALAMGYINLARLMSAFELTAHDKPDLIWQNQIILLAILRGISL